MAVGGVGGFGMGRAMIMLVNRLRLEYDGLYPVLTLALVLLTYAGSATLGGNGFLSVYVAGIVLGNRSFIHKTSLLRFHDGLAWLMQIAMFLTLGLLVFPSRRRARSSLDVLGTGGCKAPCLPSDFCEQRLPFPLPRVAAFMARVVPE